MPVSLASTVWIGRELMADGALLRNPKMVERKKTNLLKATKAVGRFAYRFAPDANCSEHGSSVRMAVCTFVLYHLAYAHALAMPCNARASLRVCVSLERTSRLWNGISAPKINAAKAQTSSGASCSSSTGFEQSRRTHHARSCALCWPAMRLVWEHRQALLTV